MPRIEYNYAGDAFGDGAGADKFLIDLSQELSTLYGKLIRQGQVFRIRQIDCRIVNPNTATQDEVMALSGKYIWYHPTAGRKKAWKVAFDTVQLNRKQLGITGSQGYDFRVGLAPGYNTDIGVTGEGVQNNAWINSASDELVLSGSGNTDIDIFGNWNANLVSEGQPVNPSGGFGHWALKDTAAAADELDFVTNEEEMFVKGEASTMAQTAPFMVSFTSVFASTVGATEAANSVTTSDSINGPIDAMCGLIGVYVDTSTVDDSTAQTENGSCRFLWMWNHGLQY